MGLLPTLVKQLTKIHCRSVTTLAIVSCGIERRELVTSSYSEKCPWPTNVTLKDNGRLPFFALKQDGHDRNGALTEHDGRVKRIG